MRRFCHILYFMFVLAVFTGTAYASTPLITEDAGTVGKGKYNLEITGQSSYDDKKEPDEDGTDTRSKSWETELKSTLTYGITETVDIAVEVPLSWRRLDTDGANVSSEKGISDVSMTLKWKFFEKNNFGAAVKSEVWLPTGDHEKELGNGRVSYSLYLLATKEIDPVAFHVNLGYKRNENKNDEREDIWHASLAGELKVIDKLSLVANIGIEKNPDRSSSVDPAFLLGGITYAPTDSIEIGLGVKGGLTYTEKAFTLIGGVNFKF